MIVYLIKRSINVCVCVCVCLFVCVCVCVCVYIYRPYIKNKSFKNFNSVITVIKLHAGVR